MGPKFVRTPADIFSLNYEKIEKLEGWGKLSIKNLKNAINNSKKIVLDRFIYSIGIRHIGQENAKILAAFFKTEKKFSELFSEKRKDILKNLDDLDGIGDTQIQSIQDFFQKPKKLRNYLFLNVSFKDSRIQNNIKKRKA